MYPMRFLSMSTALAFLLTSTSYSEENKNFPIGALFPMTGPQAFYGRVMSRGAQMAIDHLNESGGVEGYRLKLIITDFKNVDTELAINGMKKMIVIDKVPFVLVSFSAVILGVQPLCEKKRVLMINPGAYSPHLMNKPYLYSTKHIQTQMIPPMIHFLWQKGIRKLGLIYIDNPAGIVPADDIIKPIWTSMGGTIVASLSHPPGLTNFIPHLTRIRNENPDAIYDISTGQDQAYVIKNAREMGLNIPITVPDWAPDYYEIAGTTSENVYIPGDYFDKDKTDTPTRKFVTEYEARWKESPEIFAANYYDTVYNLLSALIKRVIQKSGNPFHGNELERAIWEDPTFETIYGGKMKLNKNGTCSNKPMGIFQIVDGKKILIKQVSVE